MRDLMIFPRSGLDLRKSFWDNSLFDRFFDTDVESFDHNYDLRTSVDENDDEFTIKVEMPGISEDNVSVDYKDGMLSIAASYEAEDKNENSYSLRKQNYKWIKQFPRIDSEKVEAGLKNGMLNIKLPKLEEAKSKKIEIKT